MDIREKVHRLPQNLLLQIVPGSFPFLVLAGSDGTELGLPSTHSYGYDPQSRPALSAVCPAPSFRILVKYAG